jgi:hypothetical protein
MSGWLLALALAAAFIVGYLVGHSLGRLRAMQWMMTLAAAASVAQETAAGSCPGCGGTDLHADDCPLVVRPIE